MQTKHLPTHAASPASSVPTLRTITQAQAQKLRLGRAIDRYNDAKATREEHIHAFEAEHGRCDRIDASLLRELQRLQLRFAAIAARQQRASYGEPKVSKYVEQLGVMVGSVSAHLATDRALELFAPVEKADYVGWDGKEVGDKGRDESVLDGYVVIEGNADDEEFAGEACGHYRIEPLEENPQRGICTVCDAEVALHAAGAQAS